MPKKVSLILGVVGGQEGGRLSDSDNERGGGGVGAGGGTGESRRGGGTSVAGLWVGGSA